VTAATTTTTTRRPSALGSDLRRFWSLTLTLAATDFKLRFFGSMLGYFWTIMRPLMLFGVLYVVFTKVVRLGGDVKHYPVYLLSSLVLFTYFQETTGRGVRSLVERENLLRKVRFPRLVIPLAVALHSLFNLGMNLIAVFVFILASGITPRVSWLELPLLVGTLVTFSVGVTMLLSALYVRYRDVDPIWEVVLQMTFYASPILYVVTAVPSAFREVVVYSPIAAVLTQTRHAVIDPDAPTAIDVLGGWGWLAVPVGITAAIFALGLWVFLRETPKIAENL
jgi:ABC-2 type transport system permease protein